MPSETPRAERGPVELRRDLVLVEAVPVLVHRREERLETGRLVLRRDPDVVDAAAARERVHGRIETPGPFAVPEEVDDLARERLLLVRGERAGEGAVVLAPELPGLGDERDELLLEPVEDAAHLRRLHPALVVVEQDVVLLVCLGEELDVAAAELEVALEERAEGRVVVRRLRLAPRHEALRARLDDLGAELGRHARRLLVVLARDPDQRRVVGVRVERVLVRTELAEQPLGLGRDEEVERDPVEGRLLLAPDRGAGRRHDHLHVPGEHAPDAAQVGHLGEPRLQLVERLGSGHVA